MSSRCPFPLARCPGHEGDQALYGSTIRCCLRAGQRLDAIAVLQEAIAAERPPEVETYEALIASCAESGDWKWAWELGEMAFRRPLKGLLKGFKGL